MKSIDGSFRCLAGLLVAAGCLIPALRAAEETELKDETGKVIVRYKIEVPPGIAPAGTTDPAKQVGLIFCLQEHGTPTGNEPVQLLPAVVGVQIRGRDQRQKDGGVPDDLFNLGIEPMAVVEIVTIEPEVGAPSEHSPQGRRESPHEAIHPSQLPLFAFEIRPIGLIVDVCVADEYVVTEDTQVLPGSPRRQKVVHEPGTRPILPARGGDPVLNPGV